MHAGTLAGGLTGAAIGAAAGGLPKHKFHPTTGKKQERTKKERITGAVVGGLLSGLYGASYGHRLDRKPAGPQVPSWLKKTKTRAEGRRAYHAQARKHHPDLGGDPAKFRAVQKEWEMHEPTYKTAMINAFADELEKIANAGALAGGALGYALSPKSIKGKLIGTAAGALGGMALGGIAGAAKRSFYDEPRAYEQAQLYGYQPSVNPAYGSPTRFGY